MGSWNENCSISGISIYDGCPAVVLLIKEKNYDEEYGRWYPACPAIYGTYGDYGNLISIEKDDSTKILEEHYKMSIDSIINGILRYNLVAETDQKENQLFDEEVKDMKIMWFNRNIFNSLTTLHPFMYWRYEHYDLGNPILLSKLGFTRIEDNEDARFKQTWKFNDVILYSDGNWLSNSNNLFIHHLKDLDKLGVDTSYFKGKSQLELGRELKPEKYQYDDFYIKLKELNMNIEFNEDRIYGDARISFVPFRDQFSINELFKKYFDFVSVNTSLDSEIIKLNYLQMNLHTCGKTLKPYEGRGEQFGDYKNHQFFLDKFAEINRSIVNIMEDFSEEED